MENLGEGLNRLKSERFLASSVHTYDFFTLYNTLSHNLIEEKLIKLIELIFNKGDSLYLAC